MYKASSWNSHWRSFVFFNLIFDKMPFKTLFYLLLVSILLPSCTPKTTEEAKKSSPEPEVTQATVEEEKEEEPCKTFLDAADPDEAETNYVLYRDFLKIKDWEVAFDYWNMVYKQAPAANGSANRVYLDGVKFYERFIEQTEDSLKKAGYIDKVFQLYDELQICFPDGGYVPARKGFDLFYKYPERSDKQEAYKYLKESIDADGLNTRDFVVNPFTSLLVTQYFEDKVEMEEAQEYAQKVIDIIKHNLENCEGSSCDRWDIINSYAPLRLEMFEPVKGFYDCTYYMEKYYPEFEESPEDCEVIRTVYTRLNWGDCPAEEERLKMLIQTGNELCVEEGPEEIAWELMREGKYKEAIQKFEEVAEESEDAEYKAKTYLLIAKIYNAHLKDFPKARAYARQASSVRPDWGEPYILIGRLYASSGPLCGPGRGWDSQIVTWPAIDMWNKAKRIDASVSAEANKWISRYSKYMPTKEDVFFRSLEAGDSFYIGCWIQQATTIRTSD